MTTPRTILLVGEGNFSFSAGLSQLFSETSITATCLQHQEEVLQHEGAATNIQTIRDSGGVVLFEVDSTKLGESVSLKGLVFDRVVFNFPHCGRKSGVKKNRELLKKFFLSCVQVLAEDGEIHVALCNGQGGTPADQPMREWHDSWQVVAMAAEAQLILSGVQPFESEKYKSYRCTGYREFLSTSSIHPVKLVQDFLLKGLAEKWSVSMKTEKLPFLLTSKQLQKCCHEIDDTFHYWIHLLHEDLTSSKNASTELHTDKDKTIGQSMFLDSGKRTDTPHTVLGCRSQGDECLRSTCCLDVDTEEDKSLFVLRPSLLPQMEQLITYRSEDEQRKELTGINGNRREKERNSDNVEVGGNENGDSSGGCTGFTGLLFGISGLVFRSVPIGLWTLPAFHELFLKGVFHAACDPIKLLGQSLETLLAPYGVSLVMEQGCLCLMAQPMGLVGKVFVSSAGDKVRVSVNVSLNLDLLAVLLFSLPDWRLLWSHDPRFLKQFLLCQSPGQTFSPFSLFPQLLSFDISFWAGPAWEERKFHAVVREASRGTVEQVKLIDTFSHPNQSQISYCYRLSYHSHTHALSHTQALQLHRHVEFLLSSRLQVTIR
ncbi:ferredoxin-fold anticodon-binding domain-containing protein 1 isoform 2-T2 [Polymixia lowei]